MATSIYLAGSIINPDISCKPLLATIPLDLAFGVSALVAGILGATGVITMSTGQAYCLIGLGTIILPGGLLFVLAIIALIGYLLLVCCYLAIGIR